MRKDIPELVSFLEVYCEQVIAVFKAGRDGHFCRSEGIICQVRMSVIFD